ncbi:MAG: hypothetical protein WC595_05785 [Candidatus Nanoarchaeia archaeon]
MTYDTLKRAIAEKLGENVLYSQEVESILKNLGGPSISTASRHYLRSHRITPQQLEIIPHKHGLGARITLYPTSQVWAYLQQLDRKRKIHLKEKGFSSLDDILEQDYHKFELETGGDTGRWVSRQSTPDDESDGSWSNAFKSDEEKR